MTQSKVETRRKNERLERRRKHVKKVLMRTASRPRLVVYRSNRHIYVSIVDDSQMKTITGCSTQSPALKDKLKQDTSRVAQAKTVGEHIAALAIEKGIKVVSFDRNGRRYHGRVKALAEGARAGGLEL